MSGAQPAMGAGLKRLWPRLVLLLLACVFAAAATEVALRLACPRYAYQADAYFVATASRIFRNPRNSVVYRQHPDYPERHPVIYNALGLRQSRQFSVKKPEGVVRIGVFGDSFTDNKRMEVQYSFTEPLDYLLNKTGKRYEVLNFGTGGYGTDQIYLQLMQEGLGLELDYVIYMYYRNDLRNINDNDLVQLDVGGDVVFSNHEQGFSRSLLRRFYLTYFILDRCGRLQEGPLDNDPASLRELRKRESRPRFKNVVWDFANGVQTDDVKKTLRIFSALVSRMKKACGEHGIRFCVVTLPDFQSDAMRGFLTKKGYVVKSLREYFSAVYPDRAAYRFRNDSHWNEEGNKLAAIALFKFLSQEMAVEDVGDAFIGQALYEYYTSFDPVRVTPYGMSKQQDFSADVHAAVRSKYLALDPGVQKEAVK